MHRALPRRREAGRGDRSFERDGDFNGKCRSWAPAMQRPGRSEVPRAGARGGSGRPRHQGSGAAGTRAPRPSLPHLGAASARSALVPLRPDLRAAYEKALYVVLGAPDLVIRVGERNADLDDLLDADGVETAAFLSAANPNGILQGQAENELARAALHQVLADEGCICYVGEGRDPEGEWPAEPSI